MAKRRVGNPLFETSQAENPVGLQDPGFLEGFSDDDVAALAELEGVNGDDQALVEAPPAMPIQDARQIPLKKEEDKSWLSSIGDYFGKGLQAIGSFPHPEQDDYQPEDLKGLSNLANVEEEPEQGLISQGVDYAKKGLQTIGNQVLPEMDDVYGQLGGFSEEGMVQQPGLEGTPNISETTPNIEQVTPNISPDQAQFVEQIASGEPPRSPTVTESEVMESASEGQPVSGAVELASKNPYVMEELARLAGVGEMPQELVQYANDWESALTKQMDALDEREKSLLNKFQTGEMSDFDKVALALAVAVPVIMGLMYGGAAFALAAGGTLKSFGKLQEKEQTDKDKAREELQSITKDKLKLREDGVKLKQDMLGKIPNRETREYFRNKPLKEFGNDIGIGQGDETGVLWVNSNKIHDNEDLKKVKERTKDAEELLGQVTNFNKALSSVEEIIEAIQDQDPGLFNILASDYKVLESTSPDKIGNSSLGDILSLLAKTPGLKQKPVTIEVIGKNGKLVKINALDALQQSVKALQNDYNTAVLKGSRLTENVMKHWGGIMFDPTSITQFLSSGVSGWEENARNLRNIMNRKIQEELVGYGFIRQPIQEAYPVNERTILRPVNAVNRDIMNNPDAYKNKVR